MQVFKLTVEVSDLDNEVEKASFTCHGKYLGHLIAYMMRALEPYFAGEEEGNVLADALEGLPEDHPAHKTVKLTNRAIAGDV